MIFLDTLRPPSPFDLSASGYKDWLHLNVLDHSTGTIGIINVSLHGAPGDPRSRAIGTGLAHVPGSGWLGNVEVRGQGQAAIGTSSIGLERVALAVLPAEGTVLASVNDPENGLAARLTARPSVSPVVVAEEIPLGPGWISWYAVSRLALSGHWTLGSQVQDLSQATAYHDHNWGRWHWGEDLGWEWGCFVTPAPGPALVMSLTTDRAHRRRGEPCLAVHAAGKRRTFTGAAIEIEYRGRLETVLRRLPGAMAALHADWIHPQLPQKLLLRASDGIDRVTMEFTGRAAAQLIAADSSRRGYGFIHEIVGEFSCSGELGKTPIGGTGLGVLEHVD